MYNKREQRERVSEKKVEFQPMHSALLFQHSHPFFIKIYGVLASDSRIIFFLLDARSLYDCRIHTYFHKKYFAKAAFMYVDGCCPIMQSFLMLTRLTHDFTHSHSTKDVYNNINHKLYYA
jgi:hypothetical protein